MNNTTAEGVNHIHTRVKSTTMKNTNMALHIRQVTSENIRKFLSRTFYLRIQGHASSLCRITYFTASLMVDWQENRWQQTKMIRCRDRRGVFRQKPHWGSPRNRSSHSDEEYCVRFALTIIATPMRWTEITYNTVFLRGNQRGALPLTVFVAVHSAMQRACAWPVIL